MPECRPMMCLKCQGFMMFERQYTLDSRRLYARCLNCGFWLDLADLLRFFHQVLEAGLKDLKFRVTIPSCGAPAVTWLPARWPRSCSSFCRPATGPGGR